MRGKSVDWWASVAQIAQVIAVLTGGLGVGYFWLFENKVRPSLAQSFLSISPKVEAMRLDDKVMLDISVEVENTSSQNIFNYRNFIAVYGREYAHASAEIHSDDVKALTESVAGSRRIYSTGWRSEGVTHLALTAFMAPGVEFGPNERQSFERIVLVDPRFDFYEVEVRVYHALCREVSNSDAPQACSPVGWWLVVPEFLYQLFHDVPDVKAFTAGLFKNKEGRIRLDPQLALDDGFPRGQIFLSESSASLFSLKKPAP